MEFEWDQDAPPLDGELLYRQDEYSIDFEVASKLVLAERVGSAGVTSISFTTLQIEVGIERRGLLYAWGLFPKTRWQLGQLSVPILQPGRVRVISDGEELRPGVAIPFHESTGWSVAWDQSTGWIRFGNGAFHGTGTGVEFAKNLAVVIAEGTLISIWLRPKMVS